MHASAAGIGDNVLFFVGMAQEVVLVLSPEPTSLVDAYAVVKVLSQQAGIRNFAVVINPVVDEAPTTICGPPGPSASSRRVGVSIRAGALPLGPAAAWQWMVASMPLDKARRRAVAFCRRTARNAQVIKSSQLTIHKVEEGRHDHISYHREITIQSSLSWVPSRACCYGRVRPHIRDNDLLTKLNGIGHRQRFDIRIQVSSS